MIGNIQHIAIIQSLNPEEIQTGKNLYDDVVSRRINLLQPKGNKMTHIFWDLNSLEEFLDMLEYYVVNSPYMKSGILLHIEAHGEEDRKGLILSDGSFVNWATLISNFRKINTNCCNELFVSMATCYGRFLYQGIFPYKKSPYSGYISAVEQVSPEDIIETFHTLFEELISTRNIVAAYEHIEKAQSNFYYKDMKAVFEDNFRISELELRTSPAFRKEAFKNANKKARADGFPELTKEDEETLIDAVCRDLYVQRKADFFFGECDD
jgi:hypothetical protein